MFFYAFFFIGCKQYRYAKKPLEKKSDEVKGIQTDLPSEREAWEYKRVKNPLTGEVPKENLLKVYNDYLNYQKSNETKIAIPNLEWKERGPNNVGGRTRAILFDKNDATHKTVFAAAIGGGLFKCTDIDATTPTWTKINDFFSNIGISCLVQKQAHPDTIYFGTGEGFGNADAIKGAGVWRSADGGVTFTQLGSVMNGTMPNYVNRLAIATNGTVYAASSNGLFKSTNGGASWSAFLTTGTSPSSASNTGMDVKIAANGDIYYSCTGQVWKYASSTWTHVTPSGTFFRIEIACAPSDANVIYLLCQKASGGPSFYYSSNAGSGWTSRSTPLIYDQAATATTEFTRGQSWYDLSLVVHPDTATTVYAGGIEYIKSKDAGATYRQITAWSLYAMPSSANLGANQLMHSDHHILVFKPGTAAFALFGCDGGLYKTTNFNLASPTYATINTNYNVTQYYSCAMANTAYSNNFIAGAQDNGTHKFTSAGINSVSSVSGGDGAYAFIDQTNSNKQISSYVYNNYYVSTDATSFSTLSGSNSTGDFINPSDLDGVNGILYTKGGTSTISRWTSVFGSPTRTNISITGIDISHIKVSPNTPTTIYLGTTNGYIYRITRANTGSTYSPTLLNTSSFGGRISSIDIRKAATDDTILVTQSNYGLGNSVLVTNNSTAGTPTWNDIDDNSTLPDIPINWCLMSPTYSAKAILATEMGIYSCNNIYASPAVWGQSITGLANVRVDMLKMRMADSLILAATHGRGLFTSDIFTTAKADFGADKTLVYTGESIQFMDDSYKATSWIWDFNNDGITDATIQNPTYAFATGGYKTIKLTTNGSLVKTKTDYIQVLPNMAEPYTASDGGNFDDDSKAFQFGSKVISGSLNLWERGVPTNALTTVNSGTKAWKTDLDADIVDATYQCALYSPNYNFTASGTYTLAFRKSMEVVYCNAPVAVQVQYSTDKGTTWTRLGVTSSGTNWYTRGPSTGCPVDAGIFSDQYGWTNTVSNESTSYDVSFLAGNANVAFRIVLSVASGWGGGYNVDGFMVDDFTISGPSNSALSADIETAVSEQTQPLGASATVDYYSPNGKYIATLKNNSTHDYGNTKVEIDNAGTGTLNFSSNTTKTRRILKKTIKITPTNVNPSGDVDITMYFVAAEIDSFQTTTGYNKSTLNLIKTAGNLLSTGTISNSIYGNSSTVAAHLDGTKVIANFSNGFSGLGAGTNGVNGPLPVTWLSFNGKRTGNEAALIWETASEINNSHFEVDRMIDGETGFMNVGRQTGNGTVNQISSYGFKDILPASSNGKVVYYRLKQVDYNGKFEYSNIVVLKYKNDNPTLSIYPNPGNKLLNIEVGSLEKENLSVQVFNQNGIKVFESKLVNTINTFNMEKYSSGLYLITIYSNHEPILSEKWIKQ